MPCYRPKFVIRERDGRYNFKADYRRVWPGQTKVHIRCRDCLGCREAIARDWSVRNYHHALTVNENWTDPKTSITTSIPNCSVVTLTLNPESLPENGCLDHSMFVRFMKRLRKHVGTPIQYFACGEYGGKTDRPHWHSIIYGHAFNDRYEDQDYRTGKITKMSYTLDQLWSEPAYKNGPSMNLGRASVDDFSYAGAAYVAGYVAKKSLIQGKNGPEVWDIIPATKTHPASVKLRYLAPEYRAMSRNLGLPWIKQHLESVYRDDAVYIGKYRFQPPAFYDRILRKHDLALYDQVKLGRYDGAEITAREWTPERCSAAEKIHMAKLQQRSDSR